MTVGIPSAVADGTENVAKDPRESADENSWPFVTATTEISSSCIGVTAGEATGSAETSAAGEATGSAETSAAGEAAGSGTSKLPVQRRAVMTFQAPPRLQQHPRRQRAWVLA
ncbi:hypothetical protein ACW0JT_20320 [Arthrobacter sp. SA17]